MTKLPFVSVNKMYREIETKWYSHEAHGTIHKHTIHTNHINEITPIVNLRFCFAELEKEIRM